MQKLFLSPFLIPSCLSKFQIEFRQCIKPCTRRVTRLLQHQFDRHRGLVRIEIAENMREKAWTSAIRARGRGSERYPHCFTLLPLSLFILPTGRGRATRSQTCGPFLFSVCTPGSGECFTLDWIFHWFFIEISLRTSRRAAHENLYGYTLIIDTPLPWSRDSKLDKRIWKFLDSMLFVFFFFDSKHLALKWIWNLSGPLYRPKNLDRRI